MKTLWLGIITDEEVYQMVTVSGRLGTTALACSFFFWFLEFNGWWLISSSDYAASFSCGPAFLGPPSLERSQLHLERSGERRTISCLMLLTWPRLGALFLLVSVYIYMWMCVGSIQLFAVSRINFPWQSFKDKFSALFDKSKYSYNFVGVHSGAFFFPV